MRGVSPSVLGVLNPFPMLFWSSFPGSFGQFHLGYSRVLTLLSNLASLKSNSICLLLADHFHHSHSSCF